MKKTLYIASAIILAMACKNEGTKTSAAVENFEAAVPKVVAQAAIKKTVPDDQTYSATVKANVVNSIAPQTSGRIEKINVEVGDFVKKGQVLAEMERVQLNQSELQLSNSRKEYERLKALYAKGGVSASDFESVELQYKVNKTSYENLLKNTILRSPVDGVVSARNYDVQDLYSMGQPIFTVQQIEPVKLQVAVSEMDYTKVAHGNLVEITSDALPGRIFNGRVSIIYPVVDANTHTVAVEVTVPNQDKSLRPGMYVNARVVFSTGTCVLVPDIAILKQQGSARRTAFVLMDDGTVQLRIVEIGRHIGSDYEILSGIAEGEQVIVKGHSSLRDGVKVEVEK